MKKTSSIDNTCPQIGAIFLQLTFQKDRILFNLKFTRLITGLVKTVGSENNLN